MPTITIPHKFKPRDYQLPLLKAIDSGYRNLFVLWHRRSGKDKVLWNVIVKRAFKVKGVHYYMLPTFAQSKRIIWDGIDNDGFKFLDHVPPEVTKRKHIQELKIELVNGSIIQLIGTDKYDSIRGSNPVTCVFSEYAYQNPMAYEVVKPILAANGGVAIFNTTPNGKNHSADLRKVAENSKDWWFQKLTIDDTGVIPHEEIDKLREQGMEEEFIQQEFYCSEDVGIIGSFYADRIKKLEDDKRITKGVYEPTLPVITAWDIGYKDDTAIVFAQIFGKEIRIIDYYYNSGMTMPEYAEVLRMKGYKYKQHIFPWDAKIKPMSSGKSTLDVAREYGLTNIKVAPSLSVQDGIQQVRMSFSRMFFEKDKTKELIEAARNYRRKYDVKRKVYSATPEHSWSSHGMDALRYLCIGLQDEMPKEDNYTQKAKEYIMETKYGKPIGRKPEDFDRYQQEAKRFLQHH